MTYFQKVFKPQKEMPFNFDAAESPLYFIPPSLGLCGEIALLEDTDEILQV